MTTILITGSNQGIGLGIVDQVSKRSDVRHVFATVRDPESPACADLRRIASSSSNIHIIQLTLDEQSAAAAAKEVARILGDKVGLDILVNNIGTAQADTNPEITPISLFREQIEVNLLGPQIVTVAFLPLLRKGNKKTIMNMSTLAGSITYNDGRFPFKVPAYGASKAALNFLTVDYAKYLKPEGFTVVPLSPGYTKTRMAPDATQTVEESASGIVKVLFSLSPKDTGLFYSVNSPGFRTDS